MQQELNVDKIWIRKFGGPEVLTVENDKTKANVPESDHVRIKVQYSGINFADIMMRLGLYNDAPPKPFVPGYEFSGEVVAIGDKVTHVKVGDKVYAGSVFGGYTSQIDIPANLAIKLPEQMTLEEGASLPVAFITAHAALFDMARVQKGDKVLIDCATGGVGTIALQMLQYVGANVIGLTSSNSKKALIESYGAKAMTHDEFWASQEDRFDFILNSMGGKTVRAHYNRLGPTGRVVCLGVSSGVAGNKRNIFKMLSAVISMPWFSVVGMFDKNRGVYALNALKLMDDPVYLARIIERFSLVEKMGLKPHVGAVFDAKDVGKAHQFIQEKKATGKVLLKWN